MKRWLSLAAVVVLCLALVIGVACGDEEEEREGVKEVKLGIGHPTGGIYYHLAGVLNERGFELANEHIGEFTVAGETYRWKLIMEDNMYSPAGGVASATKLIFEDGVDFMFQMGGDASMAAQPYCEESGVILFTHGTGIEAFGPDKPHTFQASPAYEYLVPQFYKFIHEQYPEVKTQSLVEETTVPGEVRGELQKECGEYYGIDTLEVDYIEYMAGGERMPIATKHKDIDPDLIVGIIIEELKLLGWEGIVAYCTMYQWMIEGVDPGQLEGFLAYLPLPFAEGVPQEIAAFRAEYEARYGEGFEVACTYPIMTLYVLTQALQKAGTVDDIDSIIEMLETETFDTPWGAVHFVGGEFCGVNHLIAWPGWLSQFQDGQFRVVQQFTSDEAEALALEVLR